MALSTAFVTGGGRGIGQSIALRLSKEGMRVAISARSSDQLAETVKLSGGSILALTGDVSDPARVKSMFAEAEEKLGPIGLLVNNAGIGGPFGSAWEADPDDWWHCLEVNLRGPFLCSRAVLPAMIARREGRIVNIVSGAGVRAMKDMSAYVASKTALIRFSENLAIEAAPHGVRVFPIRPGVVRTAMVEDARKSIPAIQSMLDENRDSPPEAAAELVWYLASGQADALSGRVFSVGEDPAAMVARAADVVKDALYVLQMRTLS
jgi:NAD(P)-dependent dehydrogenase (short-subunit alcohol dehydrogenase family)